MITFLECICLFFFGVAILCSVADVVLCIMLLLEGRR